MNEEIKELKDIINGHVLFISELKREIVSWTLLASASQKTSIRLMNRMRSAANELQEIYSGDEEWEFVANSSIWKVIERLRGEE